MSTIGQVRRMLRIQALEAAKREDYRTRTRVQKIYIKDKITSKGDYSLPEEGRRDFCRSRNPGN